MELRAGALGIPKAPGAGQKKDQKVLRICTIRIISPDPGPYKKWTESGSNKNH